MNIDSGLEPWLDRRLDELEKRIALQFSARDTAVILNAAEMSRRLDLLNGEAARLRQMQETYYPREMALKLEERLQGIGDRFGEYLRHASTIRRTKLSRIAWTKRTASEKIS
jgi:hypothetical protein